MTITQTVDIPADRRLVIDVPSEVPVGQVILTFTPASQVSLQPCPICASNIDPETGNPRYKPEVYEGMREVEDMLSGKIASTLHRHNSLDEMLADLDSDDCIDKESREVIFYRTGSHSDLY